MHCAGAAVERATKRATKPRRGPVANRATYMGCTVGHATRADPVARGCTPVTHRLHAGWQRIRSRRKKLPPARSFNEQGPEVSHRARGRAVDDPDLLQHRALSVTAAKLHDIGLSDRRRQSQKLDRPARCFHPRDRRREPAHVSSDAARTAGAARAVREVRSREVSFILEHGGTKASRRLMVRHHSSRDRRARTQNQIYRRQRWRRQRR